MAKKKKKPVDAMNLAITLICISVVFAFVGYLMGQYAVAYFGQGTTIAALNQSQDMSSEVSMRLEALGAPRGTSSSPSSPEVPLNPTVTPSTQAVTPQTTTQLYRVQVGAFSTRENAQRVVDQLKSAGYEAVITSENPFRVQSGAFSALENAERYALELRGEGFEVTVVR